MKVKTNRLEALKMIISSMELGSQEEVLAVLRKEGFELTQATLSRDMKQLKVAKAASMNGKYVYVLPNETMYKRIPRRTSTIADDSRSMTRATVTFSGNICVVKTRPGYASAVAYDIDNAEIPELLGSIAGDDTIFIVIREDARKTDVVRALGEIINI